MYRRKFNSIIKEYFSFTRGERRGILVLFVIILITIGIRISIPYLRAGNVVVRAPHKAINETAAKDNVLNNSPATSKTRNTYDKRSPKRIKIVEVNSCDTSSLEELPGIGPVLSRRILKYRGALGGYYTKAQLLEVFGMTSDNYNRFIGYISVDTLKVRKLDLNKATFKEINAHPYISFEQTKAICKLRNKNNKLNRAHFLHCEAFDPIQKIKVLTYLKFD